MRATATKGTTAKLEAAGMTIDADGVKSIAAQEQ